MISLLNAAWCRGANRTADVEYDPRKFRRKTTVTPAGMDRVGFQSADRAVHNLLVIFLVICKTIDINMLQYFAISQC